MSRKTTLGFLLAGLIFSGLASALPASAQTPAATVATTDPTLRPKTPMPAYPPRSRKNMEAGIVYMKLCVEADGRVSKAELAKTSGFPNLDNAALKWIQEVRFNPAMQGATPIALCDFRMTYEFQVTKGPTQQPKTNNPFDIGPPTGSANGP